MPCCGTEYELGVFAGEERNVMAALLKNHQFTCADRFGHTQRAHAHSGPGHVMPRGGWNCHDSPAPSFTGK